jgi:hypothetical protein
MTTGQNVLIHSPGFFYRQERINTKTADIEGLTPSNARARLLRANSETFYTIDQLKLLFTKSSSVDSDFKLINVNSIDFILRSLNDVVNDLDAGDITFIFSKLDVEPKRKLAIFMRYPELVKKLHPAFLLDCAVSNVELAKYILAKKELCKIVTRNEGARYFIYQKHKQSLWLCSNVFGLNDVERFTQYSQQDHGRGLPDNWNDLKALFLRRRNMEKEINNLEEMALYFEKLIEAHKKKQKLNSAIPAQREELETVVNPIIDNIIVTLQTKGIAIQTDDISALKRAARHNQQKISAKQQQIDDTLREFRELSERVKFGRYTLDIFLLHQNNDLEKNQVRENIDDLIAMAPRYVTLIDERHIKAMLALDMDSKKFVEIINYLASYSSTKDALITVLTAARQSQALLPLADERNDLQQKAFDNIYKYGYRDGSLFKEEAEGRLQILSQYPSVGKALYYDQHVQFAKLYDHIADTECRIKLLERNGFYLDKTHLLRISGKMSDPNERKRYFYKGKKDALGVTPLHKLRTGIDQLLREGNIDNQLLCTELAKDDLRGWIDLARPRERDSMNYVARWLQVAPKMPGDRLNDDVAKIIAQDRHLLNAIRSDGAAFERDYAAKNDYLFAANFVQKQIEASSCWFEGSRKEEFIEHFAQWTVNPDNHILIEVNNPFTQLSDNHRDAVCWYIANNKDLWERFEKRCIRKAGWFFGPSQNDELRAKTKVIKFNHHFADKLGAGLQPGIFQVQPLPGNLAQPVAARDVSVVPRQPIERRKPTSAEIAASAAASASSSPSAAALISSPNAASLRKSSLGVMSYDLAVTTGSVKSELATNWKHHEAMLNEKAHHGLITKDELVDIMKVDNDEVRQWLGKFYNANFKNQQIVRDLFELETDVSLKQCYRLYLPLLLNERLSFNQLERFYTIDNPDVDLTFNVKALNIIPFIQRKFNDELREVVSRRIQLFEKVIAQGEDFLTTSGIEIALKFFTQDGKTSPVVITSLTNLFTKYPAYALTFLKKADQTIVANYPAIFMPLLTSKILTIDATELWKLYQSNHSTVVKSIFRNRDQLIDIFHHSDFTCEQHGELLLELALESKGSYTHLLVPKLIAPQQAIIPSWFKEFPRHKDNLIALFKNRNLRGLFANISSEDAYLLASIVDKDVVDSVVDAMKADSGAFVDLSNNQVVMGTLLKNNPLLRIAVLQDDKLYHRVFVIGRATEAKLALQLSLLYGENDETLTKALLECHKKDRYGFTLRIFTGEQLVNLYQNNSVFKQEAKLELYKLREVFLPKLSLDQQSRFLYDYLRTANNFMAVADYFATTPDLTWLKTPPYLMLLLKENPVFAGMVLMSSELRKKLNLNTSHFHYAMNQFIHQPQLLDVFLNNSDDHDFILFVTDAFIDAVKHGYIDKIELFLKQPTLRKLIRIDNLQHNNITKDELLEFSWTTDGAATECVRALHDFLPFAVEVKSDELSSPGNSPSKKESGSFKRVISRLPFFSHSSSSPTKAHVPTSSDNSIEALSLQLQKLQHKLRDLLTEESNLEQSLAELISKKKDMTETKSRIKVNKENIKGCYMQLLSALYELNRHANSAALITDYSNRFFERFEKNVAELIKYCLLSCKHAESLVLYNILHALKFNDEQVPDRYMALFLMDPLLISHFSPAAIKLFVDVHHEYALFCLTHQHVLAHFLKKDQVSLLIDIATAAGFGNESKEVAKLLLTTEPIANDSRFVGLKQTLMVIAGIQLSTANNSGSSTAMLASRHGLLPPPAAQQLPNSSAASASASPSPKKH